VLATSVASAQTWSESDVLEMARQSAPGVVAAEGRVESTRALRDGVGRYPDPQLSWQREAITEGTGTSQDIISLAIPIDLSGRRNAQRTLVDSMTAFVESQAIDERSRVLAAALTAFYEGVAARERLTIAERAVHALDEAHRIVARREEEGTAAGMDRMRLNLELELAQSLLATSRIEAQQAGARLVLVLGREETSTPELAGDLSVEGAPALPGVLEGAADQPTIEALRRARTLVSDARDSAATAWIPPLSVIGGLNVEQDGNTQLGYFAGLTFSLPFFNQGRRVMATADARTAMTESQLDARARRARADVVAAHRRLVGFHAEATRLSEATEGALEGLLRAANSGYSEGRRTLVELLDARRAAVAVAMRRLDLRLEAKRAEIDLRRASGELR